MTRWGSNPRWGRDEATPVDGITSLSGVLPITVTGSASSKTVAYTASGVQRTLSEPSFGGDLAQAVAAIGADEVTLLLDIDNTVGADLSVPANIALVGCSGRTTVVSPGFTLTVGGAFIGGVEPYIDGTVVFDTSEQIIPQWWVGTVTAQLQAAAVSALAGGNRLFLPAGVYSITDTVNFRQVHVDGPDAYILANFDGIAVILGGISSLRPGTRQVLYRVQNSFDGDNPDVRIMGAKSMDIEVQNSFHIQLYAIGAVTDDMSCAANMFKFVWVNKLEIKTEADDTTGWINENIFHLAKIQELYISGGYNHNHNTFYGGDFSSGTVVLGGTSNLVRNARIEGNCSITFPSTAKYCLFTHTYHAPNLEVSPIINDGLFCGVKHESRLFADRKILCSFGVGNLRDLGSGVYNNPFVNDGIIAIGDELSVAAWAWIVETPFIPIVDGINAVEFDCLVNGLTAGGIRIYVEGYGADKLPLASTGNDWESLGGGAHGWDNPHGGINNSPGRPFWLVTAVDVPFIKIKIRAGGAATTFSGLSVVSYSYTLEQTLALDTIRDV